MGIVERLRDYANRNDSDFDKAADLIEKMGEVVREIEWSFGDNYAQCPQCYRKSDDVHAPDCKLAACLKEIST